MIELKDEITAVILHKNHDLRAEQLKYLLRSLPNINGAVISPVVVGDKVPERLFVKNVVVDEQNAFDAIKAAIAENPDAFKQDLIIFSDDMVVVNNCLISTVLIPLFNIIEKDKSSHAPFYARREIFTNTDNINDLLSDPNVSEPLEAIVNKALGIPESLLFPADFSKGPLMVNFLSVSPSESAVREYLKSRYFFHISDASFPAMKKYLDKILSEPSDYEKEDEKSDAPDKTADEPKGKAPKEADPDANKDK
jgi:hypothetical protein